MSKTAKIILFLGILTGTMLTSFADRGVGRKSKNKITLNINTNNNFKNAISFNLKAGLKYKGSLVAGVQKDNSSYITSNLVTYQKGNTIYILPYKQKMIMPEIRQGYAGMKLIIKPN